MVLIDKLSDPLCLELSGIGQTLTVRLVGLAKIQVVCRLFDVDRDALVIQGEGNAPSVPRVEFPVAENDVRGFGKIFLGVKAPEVLESPAVLGSFSESSFAVGGVFFGAP